VQTGDEEAWRGWDAERLVRFIEERAGVAEQPPVFHAKEQLVLRAYAITEAPVMAKRSAGVLSWFTAMVTIPTGIFVYEAPRARAAVDVFARRPGPQKSALLGRAEADIDLSVLTEIGLSCRQTPIEPDEVVFATARLFAAARPTEPVHRLTDVRLEVLPT
jgi:hypothetical protein